MNLSQFIDINELAESESDLMSLPRVLVIGDLMIDEYHLCKVERKVPEGPFLVWDLLKKKFELGGAGNLAKNLSAMNIQVDLLAVINKSDEQLIKNLCKSYNINPVLVFDERPTTRKIRFLDEQQMLLGRQDIESKEPVKLSIITEQRSATGKNYDAIIYCDYAKGIFSKETLSYLFSIKSSMKIADVKPINTQMFLGKTDLMKMNLKEFSALVKHQINNIDIELEKTAKTYAVKNKINLMITRGEKGISFFGKSGKVIHSPVVKREVFDITGAGDTAMAAYVANFLKTNSVEKSLDFANQASSIAVSRKGTSTVSLDEVEVVSENKLLTLEQLKKILESLRKDNKKIVFTNGCFDIIHPGHIHLLTEAKKLGDILVVGLNSDESVKKLKGPSRPLVPLEGRVAVLNSLKAVDYVIKFDEQIPLNLVKQLKPDIYVKGGDYTLDTLPESKIVQSYGGKVVLIKPLEESGKKLSTTDIINKMKPK